MLSRTPTLVLLCLLAAPSVTRAQSAITGVVRDTSGAVLPGVTVEASSDALIEQSRTAVTDGQGVYLVVDLRPGTYVVSFSITGFKSIRREGIELPSEFTATINADMSVGSIEESVTVTGASPLVDAQSAARVEVLDRDALDNLPTGRTIQGLGQMIAGVNLNLPDVGGSRAAQQTYMSVNGMTAAQNVVMVDGLTVNGLEANGAVQSYFNDAASQQIAYQTSGAGADRSGGGVGINLIPREGGNRFSGDTTLADRPGAWQGDNLGPRLIERGLEAGNSTKYIYDFTASQGGPIARKQFWFFTSLRDYRTNNRIANTRFDDGTQGDDYNYIRQGLVRLTYQVSPRNKLSAYVDKISKYRAHDMQSNVDPETASVVWTSPHYSTGSAKWTSTAGRRLLIEAGYSQNVEYRNTSGQEGIVKVRGTPEWYASATKTLTPATLGFRTTAPSLYGTQAPLRKNGQASASYVTGSHNLKAGMQWQWGRFYHREDANADLSQLYTQYRRVGNEIVLFNPPNAQGFPQGSVSIRNTPIESQESLKADFALYAQDSVRFRRMTINGGVRFEWLNSQVDQFTAPAGRFVPARTQPEQRNIPNWKDLAPRFQAVYDLFGDAKTAVKYSANRYNQAQSTSLAADFNGLDAVTSTRTWVDLNGDDIAQGQRTWLSDGTYTDCVFLTPGCEINLSGSATQGALAPTFGLIDEAARFTQFPRLWTFHQTVEVQHQLLRRMSVTAGVHHTAYHNLTKTVNLNRRSYDVDYVQLTVYNPITGEPITYYNSTADFQARPANNVTIVEPLYKISYRSYYTQWRWRPRGGGQVFGGVTWERVLSTNCQTSLPDAFVDPNSLRFCDERQNHKPFAVDFRLAATYPLPWGITLGATYLNNDEGSLDLIYTFSRTIRYPDGSANYLAAGKPAPACPAPCPAGQITAPTFVGAAAGASVRLSAPGTVDAERLKQLDVKVSKNWRLRHATIAPTFEVFNLLNHDMVITNVSESYANAAGTYLRPNSVLQGRIVGWGARVRW